ncbi:MAG: DUF2189 domain-containing protein [Sphingomonadaceae bacterium]|nr:DUF2189 domain-containing protein [Sphingomonadaceae bacterium]
MSLAPTATPTAAPQVRHLTPADLRASLKAGVDDFQLMPTYLVLLTLIYPAVGLIAARWAQGNDIVPLIFPLISGFALVGPLAAVGLYELSRRREAGLDTRWTHVFDVLKAKSLATIIGLAVILTVLFVAWLASALAIQRWAFGSSNMGSMTAFLGQVFDTAAGVRLIVVGNLVGFVFAAVTLCIAAFSFPMALDRDVGLPEAVATSVRVAAANPMVMAMWGLIVVGLLVLGAIPAFVGLAVVMPILGHATWHLYRRAVG